MKLDQRLDLIVGQSAPKATLVALSNDEDAEWDKVVVQHQDGGVGHAVGTPPFGRDEPSRPQAVWRMPIGPRPGSVVTMKIRVDGYLVEQKLAMLLRQLVGDRWGGVELKIAGTRRRWDMGFDSAQGQVAVEFDGDEHYRNALKIKADREKDTVAATQGVRVVRVPYWIQLDSTTFRHFFGFEAEIEQDFPHGFITTKLFPASFCELGVERFRRELEELPLVARNAVITSLLARAKEHGLEYVLPSPLRYLLASMPAAGPPV